MEEDRYDRLPVDVLEEFSELRAQTFEELGHIRSGLWITTFEKCPRYRATDVRAWLEGGADGY